MSWHSNKIIYIIILLISYAIFLERCNKKLQQGESTKYKYIQLAENFYKEGNYSQAYKHVNKAMKIDPNYNRAHLLKANIFETAVDSCVVKKENKLDYSDKLVLELAYLEFKNIKMDSIYSGIAKEKMDYIRPALRDPNEIGFGVYKDEVEPAGDCYKWIKEKLPTRPNWNR